MAYVAERRTGLVVDECRNEDPAIVNNMIEAAWECGYGIAFHEITENGDVVIWVD